MLHHFKAYISRINNMHSLLFLDKIKYFSNTNTAIDKSTDHGDDINKGIDPESETQMSESNNKTTETESERSEHGSICICIN
jgi:hypothetical protein